MFILLIIFMIIIFVIILIFRSKKKEKFSNKRHVLNFRTINKITSDEVLRTTIKNTSVYSGGIISCSLSSLMNNAWKGYDISGFNTVFTNSAQESIQIMGDLSSNCVTVINAFINSNMSTSSRTKAITGITCMQAGGKTNSPVITDKLSSCPYLNCVQGYAQILPLPSTAYFWQSVFDSLFGIINDLMMFIPIDALPMMLLTVGLMITKYALDTYLNTRENSNMLKGSFDNNPVLDFIRQTTTQQNYFLTQGNASPLDINSSIFCPTCSNYDILLQTSSMNHYNNVAAAHDNNQNINFNSDDDQLCMLLIKFINPILGYYNYSIYALIYPAIQISLQLGKKTMYGIDVSQNIIQIQSLNDINNLLFPIAFPVYVDTSYYWQYDGRVTNILTQIISDIIIKDYISTFPGKLFYPIPPGGMLCNNTLLPAGILTLDNSNIGYFDIAISNETIAHTVFSNYLKTRIHPRNIQSLNDRQSFCIDSGGNISIVTNSYLLNNSELHTQVIDTMGMKTQLFSNVIVPPLNTSLLRNLKDPSNSDPSNSDPFSSYCLPPSSFQCCSCMSNNIYKISYDASSTITLNQIYPVPIGMYIIDLLTTDSGKYYAIQTNGNPDNTSLVQIDNNQVINTYNNIAEAKHVCLGTEERLYYLDISGLNLYELNLTTNTNSLLHTIPSLCYTCLIYNNINYVYHVGTDNNVYEIQIPENSTSTSYIINNYGTINSVISGLNIPSIICQIKAFIYNSIKYIYVRTTDGKLFYNNGSGWNVFSENIFVQNIEGLNNSQYLWIIDSSNVPLRINVPGSNIPKLTENFAGKIYMYVSTIDLTLSTTPSPSFSVDENFWVYNPDTDKINKGSYGDATLFIQTNYNDGYYKISTIINGTEQYFSVPAAAGNKTLTAKGSFNSNFRTMPQTLPGQTSLGNNKFQIKVKSGGAQCPDMDPPQPLFYIINDPSGDLKDPCVNGEYANQNEYCDVCNSTETCLKVTYTPNLIFGYGDDGCSSGCNQGWLMFDENQNLISICNNIYDPFISLYKTRLMCVQPDICGNYSPVGDDGSCDTFEYVWSTNEVSGNSLYYGCYSVSNADNGGTVKVISNLFLPSFSHNMYFVYSPILETGYQLIRTSYSELLMSDNHQYVAKINSQGLLMILNYEDRAEDDTSYSKWNSGLEGSLTLDISNVILTIEDTSLNIYGCQDISDCPINRTLIWSASITDQYDPTYTKAECLYLSNDGDLFLIDNNKIPIWCSNTSSSTCSSSQCDVC